MTTKPTLREALSEVVAAWESLPSGYYNSETIAEWIRRPMFKAIKSARAAIAQREAQPEPVAWRCFHCAESFADVELAEDHFGKYEYSQPACQIDAAEYRAMEERMWRYNDDDSDLHRQMARMESDHQIALRREEEAGYAKGLRDAAAPPQKAQPVPELGDRFMEILRAIHGDMPDAFADSARLAFVHALKEREAQPAPEPLSHTCPNCGAEYVDAKLHDANAEIARLKREAQPVPEPLVELEEEWFKARAVDLVEHPVCRHMAQVGDRMRAALRAYVLHLDVPEPAARTRLVPVCEHGNPSYCGFCGPVPAQPVPEPLTMQDILGPLDGRWPRTWPEVEQFARAIERIVTERLRGKK